MALFLDIEDEAVPAIVIAQGEGEAVETIDGEAGGEGVGELELIGLGEVIMDLGVGVGAGLLDKLDGAGGLPGGGDVLCGDEGLAGGVVGFDGELAEAEGAADLFYGIGDEVGGGELSKLGAELGGGEVPEGWGLGVAELR